MAELQVNINYNKDDPKDLQNANFIVALMTHSQEMYDLLNEFSGTSGGGVWISELRARSVGVLAKVHTTARQQEEAQREEA